MFNSQQPSVDDLPTSKQLVKSTIIALTAAIAILFIVVLPSEYGIDHTGLGEMLGLKAMGDIKTSLEAEAEAEESEDLDNAEIVATETNSKSDDLAVENKNDVIVRTLAPGEAIEIKLEMSAGAIAKYSWETTNGRLNFNFHGDGYKGTNQKTTYKKGRMVSADEGEILAEFDGYHGWFWRNREKNPVIIRLEMSGNYLQIK